VISARAMTAAAQVRGARHQLDVSPQDSDARVITPGALAKGSTKGDAKSTTGLRSRTARAPAPDRASGRAVSAMVPRGGPAVADGRRRSNGRLAERDRANVKVPAGRLRELPQLEGGA
jgi:hypothetical protein